MQHKQSKENSPLYQLFYDYYVSKKHDSNLAKEFAFDMESIFKSSLHKIVTISKNLDDGIGDYVSQLYFIEKLTKLLEECPDVSLSNISFVSDKKRALAKIIRQDIIPEETIYILTDNNTKKYSSETSIIGIPNQTNKQIVNNLLSEADFIFNIAIRLTSEDNNLMIARINFDPYPKAIIPAKKTAYLASWLQYRYESKEKKILNKTFVDPYIDSSYTGPIFSQQSMGIHENQNGIRFVDSISESVHKSKTDLIASLSDAFKRNIPLDTIENQSFAAGYLQSDQASQEFALLAIETSPKNGDMNILANTSHFTFDSEKPEKKEIFENTLRKLGITSIELIDENDTKTISLSNNDKSEPRILRLIDLKGINNADKFTLYALSEMIGGSGDTSISEMITAGLKIHDTGLPFPQRYITSTSSCIQSLLEEVKAFDVSGKDHKELYQYLNDLNDASRIIPGDMYLRKDQSLGFDSKKIDPMWIKNNRDTITQSWNQFCQYLYQERNVNEPFNELIVTYCFHQMIRHNQLDALVKLSKFLDKDLLQNESLLHLAVKLNNTQAVKYILENDLSDINKAHSFNGYTALHMAVQQNNEEIVRLLLENPKINPHTLDKKNLSALHVAAKTGNMVIFELLYQHDSAFPNQEYANNLLIACVEQNNSALIDLAIEKGADLNIIYSVDSKYKKITPLIYAIINNHYEMAQVLLAKGADVNFTLEDGLTPLFLAIISEDVNVELITLLLQYKPELNTIINYAYSTTTTLIEAIKIENAPILQLLLEQGADVTINEIFHGNTIISPLMLAAQFYRNIEMVQLLLQYNAPIELNLNKIVNPEIKQLIERKKIEDETIVLDLVVFDMNDNLEINKKEEEKDLISPSTNHNKNMFFQSVKSKSAELLDKIADNIALIKIAGNYDIETNSFKNDPDNRYAHNLNVLMELNIMIENDNYDIKQLDKVISMNSNYNKGFTSTPSLKSKTELLKEEVLDFKKKIVEDAQKTQFLPK